MTRPKRTQSWDCIRRVAGLLILISLLVPSIAGSTFLPDRAVATDNDRIACRNATPVPLRHGTATPARNVAGPRGDTTEMRTIAISPQGNDSLFAIDVLDEANLVPGAAALPPPHLHCSVLPPAACTRLPANPDAPPTPPPESSARS